MDGVAGQAGLLGRFTHRRPHAALEWDSSRKKVVAPKCQVGLSEAQTTTDRASSRFSARLVDGFDIPKELLQLPDLNSILSLETWETCLSETEREFLSTYLPEGFDPDYIVEALSDGKNFHFGNPLQRWGQGVCTGAMHPDAILQRELKLKQERNAYFKRLSSYHGNMLQNLQKLKDIWEDCEDPEDFLSHIQRGSKKPGLTIRGNSLGKHGQRTLKRPSDVAFPRVLGESGDEVMGKAKLAQSRSKNKKLKGNKIEEEGSKQLKVKPTAGEIVKATAKSTEEGPKKKKSRTGGDVKDVLTRPKSKGGNAPVLQEGEHSMVPKTGTGEIKRLKTNLLNEGSKKPQIVPSGAKRLTVKPFEERVKQVDLVEEDSKRVHNRPLNGGVKRPPNRPSEVEAKGLQAKLPDQSNKRLDNRTVANDEVKGLKLKVSDKGAKRLKVRSSGENRLDLNVVADKTKDLSTGLQEDDLRRLQAFDEDTSVREDRPRAKRQMVRGSADGPKILENQRAGPASMKLNIKMVGGRQTLQINSPEARDPHGRSKAKKEKSTFTDGGPARQIAKVPEEKVKKLKFKPPANASNIPQRMDPSREVPKVVPKSARAGGKRSQPKLAGGQSFASKSEEMREFSPRLQGKKRKGHSALPEAKRQKKKPDGNRKDEGQRKSEGKENAEIDLGGSDLEGEWFKKYVQVAVGPVSGQKMSKAVQSVKVSSRLFQDVKRRTQAGEEVHLETWHPEQQQVSTNGSPAGKETELIANFWQTMVHRDVPIAHAAFMEKTLQHQKTAIHFALVCVDWVASRSEPWNLGSAGETYESGSEGYVSGEPDVEGGEASGNEEKTYVSEGEGSGSEDAWITGEDWVDPARRRLWSGAEAEESADRPELWASGEDEFSGDGRRVSRSSAVLSVDEEDVPSEGEDLPNEGDDIPFEGEAEDLRATRDDSPRGSESLVGGLQTGNEFPEGVESPGRNGSAQADGSYRQDASLGDDGSPEEEGSQEMDRSSGRDGSPGRGGSSDGDGSPQRVEAFSSDNEASDYEVSPNREDVQSEGEAVASEDDDGMSSGGERSPR